jgi:hypothetical protein
MLTSEEKEASRQRYRRLTGEDKLNEQQLAASRQFNRLVLTEQLHDAHAYWLTIKDADIIHWVDIFLGLGVKGPLRINRMEMISYAQRQPGTESDQISYFFRRFFPLN